MSIPPQQSSMYSNMSTGGGGVSVGGGGGTMPSPMAHMPPAPTAQVGRGFPPTAMAHAGGQPGLSMGMTSVSGTGGAPSLSGLQGPPPLAHAGGLSISDAFEGLGGTGDTGSISSYRASSPVPSSGFQMAHSYDQSAYSNTLPNQAPRATLIVPESASTLEQQPAAKQSSQSMTTVQLASSYDMGEANEELQKLRDALQKLQAENISLKANMGNMTDEEHDVQKELNATIAEVTKLASELTKSRAQVLASKSRLLESTAELKAANEKKGYVA